MKSMLFWLCVMCWSATAICQTPTPDPVGANGPRGHLPWWDCEKLQQRVAELGVTIRNQEIRVNQAHGVYLQAASNALNALEAYRAAATNLERYNRLKELERAEAAKAAAMQAEQYEITILEMLRILQLSYAQQFVDGDCHK